MATSPSDPGVFSDFWSALGRQTRVAGRALGRRSLRLLLIAYFLHVTARKGARIAILIYAFDIGGVRAAAGVAVAQTLAAAVFAPVGSSLGDRVRPNRALLIGYAAQSLGLLLVGGAIIAGLPLIGTAVTSALAACAFTLTRPVHMAALPDVAEHPDELTLGNAATAWVDGLASMVGPLAAGVLLVTVGVGEELIVLAALCLVSGALAARIPIQRVLPLASGISLWRTVTAGASELRRDVDAARLIGLITLQYVIVGLIDVLLVVLVVDVLDRESASASLLAAAVGAGSAVGGMGSVLMAGRQRLQAVLLGGAVLTGIPVMVLGVAPGIWVAGALLIGYGIGKSVVTVASQTLLQRTIRNDVAARVFGVNEGLIQAGTALGSALGPMLVLGLGPKGALFVAGLLLPAATLVMLSSLTRLDARAVVPGPVFDLLRGVPFLSTLPLRTLESLSRASTPASAPASQIILQEGEPGNRYYVIKSGVARVEVAGEFVRRLEQGEGFGEVALLTDSPRTASIIAEGPLDLVILERSDFLGAVAGTATADEGARRHVQGWLDADARRSDTSE